MNECPKCKSQKVISGHLAAPGHSIPSVVAFVPGTLKWYRFSIDGGANLKPEAFACPDCGMVWSMAAYPEYLRVKIRETGDAHQ